MEPLEVELLRQPQERGALARHEPVAGQLGAGEALEGLASRRKAKALVLVAGKADELRLEEPRRPRVDQLPADRLEERVDDRRRPDRPHPSHAPHRVPDERVVAEAAEELSVVVVGGEDEAKLGERLVGLLALDPRVELPVRLLRDPGQRGSAARLEGDREDPVAEEARRVALHPCGESERVGLNGRDRRLERHSPETTWTVCRNPPSRSSPLRSRRIRRSGRRRGRSRRRFCSSPR